jgi:hypothetical protein
MQWFRGHGLYTDCNSVFDDDFVDLGITFEVEIVVFRPGRVNVGMSSVTSTARITVDPFQPMLCAMSVERQRLAGPSISAALPCLEILQIICDGEAL